MISEQSVTKKLDQYNIHVEYNLGIVKMIELE